jgi:hypothetical protein
MQRWNIQFDKHSASLSTFFYASLLKRDDLKHHELKYALKDLDLASFQKVIFQKQV